MASERADGRTPNRVIRIDTPAWELFDLACKAEGISRSDAIRQFIYAKNEAFERKQRRIARETGNAAGDS